jgi:hypothetical protein
MSWPYTNSSDWPQANHEEAPFGAGGGTFGSVPKKANIVSRYSIKEATLRIEKAMGRSRPPIQNKELAAAIGMAADVFSRKMRITRSTFTLDELGAIADFFEAPEGWPILDGNVARHK